jgi:hypothetical protein
MKDLAAQLLKEHRFLQDLLHRHGQSLVAMEEQACIDTFTAYCQLLHRHMSAEEELLSRQQAGGRWPASLYLAEHAKMRSLLQRHARLLSDAWPAMESSGQERASHALMLLEDYFRLCHLAEHHHRREEVDLLTWESFREA